MDIVRVVAHTVDRVDLGGQRGAAPSCSALRPIPPEPWHIKKGEDGHFRRPECMKAPRRFKKRARRDCSGPSAAYAVGFPGVQKSRFCYLHPPKGGGGGYKSRPKTMQRVYSRPRSGKRGRTKAQSLASFEDISRLPQRSAFFLSLRLLPLSSCFCCSSCRLSKIVSSRDTHLMMSLPTSSMEGGKRAPPRVGAFFKAEIDPRHGEMILFGCCLSSGLVDSTTYNGVVQVPRVLAIQPC